jgi:hypothetical protein
VDHSVSEDTSRAALSWSSASNIETGVVMSFSPQVAVETDGGGTAMAIWTRQEDPVPLDANPQKVYRLYAAYYNGTTWDATPDVIDTLSAQYFSATAPKLSMDDNGDALAVWQQYDGTAERVYARRFSSGSWGTIQQLNNSIDFTTFNAAAPAVAMDPDGGGSAMAVWSQYYQTEWLASFGGAQESIRSLAVFNGALYAGQGDGAGDGDLYVYDSMGWDSDGNAGNGTTAIRDFGATIERVSSLAADAASNRLYAGLGATQGDAEVWQCNPATSGDASLCESADWTSLSPATLDPGNVIEEVTALTVFNGTVYAGLCCTGTDGDVYYFNGVNWVSSLDPGAAIGRVGAFAVLGGKLYAAIGEDALGTAGEGDDVWVCDPAAGGVSTTVCDAAADWTVLPDMDGAATNIEAVTSLAVLNGKLYAGGCCTAGVDDQVYVYDPGTNTWSLSRSFGGTYESVRSLADYNGRLYAGLGETDNADGDIFRCIPGDDAAGPLGTQTCDDSAVEWTVSLDSTLFGSAFALAVYNGDLYAGMGSPTAGSGDGDVVRFSVGWQTMARRYVSGGWASTDTATGCSGGGTSGSNDGICSISGGASVTYSDSPVVAMDQTGRAISAFVRGLSAVCYAPPTAALPANNNVTLALFVCYDSSLFVNQFDGASWLGSFEIDPDAPTPVVPCYQNADGTGGALRIVNGLTTTCVTAAQPRIAMDRAGNALVTAKLYWSESEDAAGCEAGLHDGSNGDNDCDLDPFLVNGNAYDEWNGNAIAAIRYDGAGWLAADWTNTFLYAHSNQPTDATLDGGSERFYNCPAAGRVQQDSGSRVLIECQLNFSQTALADMSAGTARNALAVWERFDGTNHDVYADCYTLQDAVNRTTCGGAAAQGWRSSFAVPALGTATNDCYTVPYFVMNDTTWTVGGCPTAGGSREAYSPQAALDSTGSGLVVWTQKDSGRWRVYGMRFRANTGFDTATRGTIDGYPGGDLHYTNPVLAMEWANPANGGSGFCPGGVGVNCGNGWSSFLESQYLPAALLPSALNVRVRTNRWLCQSGAGNC